MAWEVFKKSVSEKEFDFDRDTVSDNYLRFGVDNNHLSTIGFYGVTPDGKVFDAN
ncbi:MAG: hypothetical protein FWG53_04820 [Clostridiales bacterium]|nr:hypothetical protein [Clostridiales bacterium]